MTNHQDLRGPAIQALVYLAAYDSGQGVTLTSVEPGFWQVGDSGCIAHADTLHQLAHAGLLDMSYLVEGCDMSVTVTQDGRDYLTHHHNARKDRHQ
ncbi:hypothetical protein [Nonomuraea sp. NPDC050786]|uniref:hypothetical protein n=1 Tax=Nonomuraea sp. NPDC050786 TaxID=3154840 RepID=UPI00340233FC